MNDVIETEEIQSVRMICREALIVLGHDIFSEEFLQEGEEEPKRSDFKNRSRISISGLLPGGENSELRDHQPGILQIKFPIQIQEQYMKLLYV